MSAVGTILNNNVAHNLNGDISVNKGMLGLVLKVKMDANFSIDPSVGNLNGTRGKFYHTYIIDTKTFVGSESIITLQNPATFSDGWRTRIVNAGTKELKIRKFGSAANITIIKVNFAAEFILYNADWLINFFMPKLTVEASLTNRLVSYDINGDPQLFTPLNISSGLFVAKTSTATNLNVVAGASILWNSNVLLDALIYSNNIATGEITFLRTGYYEIDATVGILLTGSATIGNTNINIILVSPLTTLNVQKSSATLASFTNNVFNAKTIYQFTVGQTIRVVCSRNPVSIGTITASIAGTNNGCFIKITYLG